MRVLFCVHGYKPAWKIGGPVISVSSLAEELQRRGVEVVVYTTNCNLDEDLDVPTDRAVDVDGVSVRYFRRSAAPGRFLPRVSYLSKSVGFLYSSDLARSLAASVGRFDAIHTHLPFIHPTYAGARAAFRAGKPLFYHQRGVFDPERLKFRSIKKRIFLDLVERPVLKRATTLIALTEAERDSYRALGVDTECAVIPNGIHVGDELAVTGNLDLAGCRIGPDQQVVLFMGRIHPIKGVEQLMEAFLSVSTGFPRALLVVAGPDEFGLRAGLQQRARECGFGERVLFPGMVEGAAKKALLARADLFCLPSVAEGFSMAVLEAMAASTAVLLSPGCHFPEAQSAGAGLVTDIDAPSIARQISLLLSDPGRLMAMGKAGRELVAAEYSWPRIAERMHAVYEEGIGRHRRVGNRG